MLIFYYSWDKFFLLLIYMEGLIIIVFVLFCLFLGDFYFSFELISFFLSILVIEGTFGLSILIYVVFGGGDSNFNLSFFY